MDGCAVICYDNMVCHQICIFSVCFCDLLINSCYSLISQIHGHSNLIQQNADKEDDKLGCSSLSEGFRVASATTNVTSTTNSYSVGGTSESVPALATGEGRHRSPPMIVKSGVKSHLPTHPLDEVCSLSITSTGLLFHLRFGFLL